MSGLGEEWGPLHEVKCVGLSYTLKMRKSKKIGTCIVHTQCIAHTNVTTQMSVGYLGIFQLLVVGLLPFSTLPDHPSPKYPASG